VLQCVSLCCSVSQCVVVGCSGFHRSRVLRASTYHIPVYDGVLMCVAVCCSVLQCVAVCCSIWQCAAVYCSVLRFVAVHCTALVLSGQAYNILLHMVV